MNKIPSKAKVRQSYEKKKKRIIEIKTMDFEL